ncbi:thylakoid lumenal 19 kDa protein, chloroplastic [Eucalyptus grandis]|uniref:thylakoid lumenal 19 kDa protein, chloroplastic n=1 Tax=Eucalyptus grandis TaxID=71139 RepID=UPI00192EE595|nr:thylakoid lumenal 19 kDa protein, chloroplastic [Eucalyptus grandis]
MAPAATAFNSVLLAAYVVVVALLSVPAATRVSAQGLEMAPSPGDLAGHRISSLFGRHNWRRALDKRKIIIFHCRDPHIHQSFSTTRRPPPWQLHSHHRPSSPPPPPANRPKPSHRRHQNSHLSPPQQTPLPWLGRRSCRHSPCGGHRARHRAAFLAESPPATYRVYYGTAASAANYGGYGGNASKQDTAEYVYDVPDGWKERLVSKVEKGTNGTDSEFCNPKKRTEKEYLTFLAGFRQLAPKDAVLNNLALSDVELQDLIASADNISSVEKKDEKGQLYYVYEIDGVGAHSLISVTCANNKLYAHFVNAPAPEWNRDQETLRHIHESFKTVGS